MKKIQTGILFGIIAGIIDVVPMILQGLSWDANVSAFVMWIVVSFFISTTELKLKGCVKGILFSFLVLAPCAIIIGAKEPVSLVPIAIMTLILGGAMGYGIERVNKKISSH
ncbi:MAG: hypothetical protein GXP46_13375 [Deferribacteres bacterium]|nr:hypothetical protein [Deferribacteres bacterium]